MLALPFIFIFFFKKVYFCLDNVNFKRFNSFFQLKKTQFQAIMGNQLSPCGQATCDGTTKMQQIQFIPRFKNIQEIEVQITQYSKKNKLIFYPTHQRAIIQMLLALRQRHICDKLVQFTNTRQDQSKKNLISDLLKVDFQKMDQLFFGTFKNYDSIDIKQFESKASINPDHSSKSTIHLQASNFPQLLEIDGNLVSKSQIVAPNDQQTQIKPKVRMQKVQNNVRVQNVQNNKKNKIKFEQKLTSNYYDQYTKVGEKSIKLNQIIVMACIQCFNGIGASIPSQLPTKKSPLQIILDKIEAINNKYHEDTLQNHQNSFKNQEFSFSESSKSNKSSLKKNNSIELILLVNAQYLDSTTQLCTNKYPMLNSKIHIIRYESVLPSFDQQGKIILLENNDGKTPQARLDFLSSNGDLIDFINRNMYIAELLEKYRYLHWIDPMNLLDKICDPFSIGCLKGSKQFENQRSRIIVKCIEIEQKDNGKLQFLEISNGFIQNEQVKQSDSSSSIGQNNNGNLNTQHSTRLSTKDNSSNKRIELKRVQQSNKLINQKNNISLIKSIILSTNLLTNRSKFQDRLFLTRIKRHKVQKAQTNSNKNTFFFKRSIEDIIEQRITKIILVQKSLEYGKIEKHDIQASNTISLNLIKKRRISDAVIAYSNYCKHFLKIDNGNDLQLVEICPQILFGAKNRQKKIIQSFRNYNKIGFPLIIKKNSAKNEEEST